MEHRELEEMHEGLDQACGRRCRASAACGNAKPAAPR